MVSCLSVKQVFLVRIEVGELHSGGFAIGSVGWLLTTYGRKPYTGSIPVAGAKEIEDDFR